MPLCKSSLIFEREIAAQPVMKQGTSLSSFQFKMLKLRNKPGKKKQKSMEISYKIEDQISTNLKQVFRKSYNSKLFTWPSFIFTKNWVQLN